MCLVQGDHSCCIWLQQTSVSVQGTRTPTGPDLHPWQNQNQKTLRGVSGTEGWGWPETICVGVVCVGVVSGVAQAGWDDVRKSLCGIFEMDQ